MSTLCSSSQLRESFRRRGEKQKEEEEEGDTFPNTFVRIIITQDGGGGCCCCGNNNNINSDLWGQMSSFMDGTEEDRLRCLQRERMEKPPANVLMVFCFSSDGVRVCEMEICPLPKTLHGDNL